MQARACSGLWKEEGDGGAEVPVSPETACAAYSLRTPHFRCIPLHDVSSKSQCREGRGCGNGPRVCEQRSPGPETPKRFGVSREGLGGAAQTRCLDPLASFGQGEDEAPAGGLAEGQLSPA